MKIYLATDVYQGNTLSKVRADRRLLSYHYLISERERDLLRYFKTGIKFKDENISGRP